MSLNDTIDSMVTRIREAESCRDEVEKLQGEVLQVKVTDGKDYRLVFRNHTVELDSSAQPTFRIKGTREVFNSLSQRQLTPVAAIMTRRLKVTFDPARMPLFRRVLAVGFSPVRAED